MSIPASSTAPTIWRIGAQHLAGEHAAGLGRPGAGRHARVDDVDVEGQVDRVRAVERLGDRVVDDRLGAALLDLAHEVPAQALLLHPVERLERRPVAAQADLDEVAAVDRARFDQPAHRRAVAGQHAEVSLAVSAWASKWTMPMLPGRRTSATAVADGQVIEWSPPRMIGIAPVAATSRTLR